MHPSPGAPASFRHHSARVFRRIRLSHGQVVTAVALLLALVVSPVAGTRDSAPGAWSSSPGADFRTGDLPADAFSTTEGSQSTHVAQALAVLDARTLEQGLYHLAVALVPTRTPTPTATPTSTPPPTPVPIATPQQPAAPPSAPAPPASAPESPPPAGCPTASVSGYALGLFNAINSERTQRGMPALAAHGCVTYVAQIRSNDMASRGYFSHVSPEGATAFSLMDQYGVPYGWAGENLVWNDYPDSETVAVAIRDLMASSGHRANILGANYTHMGVAVANDGQGAKYFTIVFIGGS